jgi:hypothetical protein
MLRGLANISFWADDVRAARAWYTELLGIGPYFEDRKYAPPGAAIGPGGVIAYWHVDDVAATLEKLTAMGAKVYEPLTHRGDAGWITASVVDPFGNILGIIYNPHYLQILGANGTA